MQGGGTMKECITCKYYQLMGRLPACNKKRKILLAAEMKEQSCWQPNKNYFKDFFENILSGMEGAK